MYAGKKISLFNIWNNTEVELRKEKSMDIPVSVTLIKWHGFISEEQNLSEDEKKKNLFSFSFWFPGKVANAWEHQYLVFSNCMFSGKIVN